MSFLAGNAYADTPAATTTSAGLLSPANTSPEAGLINNGFFLVFIFLVMYFLMIRPQQKKYKLHQAMVSGIKRGDKVVTSGGILGKVTQVDDKDGIVQVEIADGIKVKVLAATISTIIADTPVNDNVAVKKTASKK